MLLRNAMLTPDTLNAITFQLTSVSSISQKRSHTVTIDASVVKAVPTAILSTGDGPGDSEAPALSNDIKLQCASLLASAEQALSDTSPSITLADTLAALRQVRVSSRVVEQTENRHPVSTMMGSAQGAPRVDPDNKRRKIEDTKKTTLCFGCGKTGHWFSDRRECQNSMDSKLQNKQQREGKGLRGPVFRRGGQ